MNVKNLLGHYKTVSTHRRIVRKLCFKMGLYKQGLTHDLSKFSFTEFIPSVKYYQGTRSPIDAERKDLGYSMCWQHHKGHNPHHWQYWIQFEKGEMMVIKMPLKYVKEMVADRVAACMVYQKEKYHPSSALEFLEHSRETHLMNPQTKELLKRYLTIVAENDLDTALDIIKKDEGVDY